MSLTAYKEKRKLNKTPEPGGKTKKTLKLPIFVVQRHKARRLHYDFRIEADGVLKSWAVPKGPSMNAGDKRLAMKVEDHPYDYKDFEGVIPEGNYGAGIVEIWDSGTFSTLEQIKNKKEIEQKTIAGIEKGMIKIHLYGKKLKGEFALVKTINEYQKDAWLLIKHKDKFAVEDEYNSEDHTEPGSPINQWLHETKDKPHGRSSSKPNKEILQVSAAENKNTLPDTGNKELIKPMLAKDVPNPFDDKNWIFEIKWDGYRAIAEVDHGAVRLYSRNGIMFNNKFPEIIKALKQFNANMVLDGEIVLLDKEGKPDFGLLHDYQNNSQYPLNFYVFDILFLNKKNLCNLPLLERKKILKENIEDNDIVRYTDHFSERGIQFFTAVQKLDLEGIMAKNGDSLYYPGRRTANWLKIKQRASVKVYIAGYTEPSGDRSYFGSLVLASFENDHFIYTGHVGTGFNESLLKKIYGILEPLRVPNSPFDIKIPTRTPITWVQPSVMCEVKFTEITKAGIMRHPVFAGLINNDRSDMPKEHKSENLKVPAQKASKKEAIENEIQIINENEKEKIYNADGIEVKISNPQKIYFPEDNVGKGVLADYYYKIAPYILPYLKNRAQSLNRYPNGIHKSGFYHKNAGEKVPEWVDTHTVVSESSNRDIEYILCNNKASLLYLINLGCIELNPWHSVANNDDNPDYLVIDLDPSKENTFSQVVEAAKVVKSVLDQANAEGYCKTSGASGLHIYIPLGAKYSYEEAKNFAHLICMLTHEQIPNFTTLERNLNKRGKDKIYLDYLQNRRGQTIASVYSVRPQIGAPVSTPLHWDEVKPGLNPGNFNIFNTIQRVSRLGDLFYKVLGSGIDIENCLRKLS